MYCGNADILELDIEKFDLLINDFAGSVVSCLDLGLPPLKSENKINIKSF